MQIIIKGRQMQVTPQLRQRIERKMQRLSRLVDDNSRVEVTVAEEKTRSAQDRYSVHVLLCGNTYPIRSEAGAVNATTALDLVIDKVMAQLGRHKDRLTKGRRHQAVRVMALASSCRLSSIEEEEEQVQDELVEDTSVGEQENEQIWSKILEIRRLPTRPMSDQEVIAQMEKGGASFYPFYNEETNSVNVMYRLEEGGYGLLVPALVE